MEYATPIISNNIIEIEPVEQPRITVKIGGVNHVESLEHRNALKENSKVLVIKYGAEWCGPCQKSAPAFLELANEDADHNCVYASEDVDDELGELPEPIKTIPVFHIYKKGVFERSIKGIDMTAVQKVLDILKR
jgi:thiol-disulfide isomerase/thioredoxin